MTILGIARFIQRKRPEDWWAVMRRDNGMKLVLPFSRAALAEEEEGAIPAPCPSLLQPPHNTHGFLPWGSCDLGTRLSTGVKIRSSSNEQECGESKPSANSMAEYCLLFRHSRDMNKKIINTVRLT